MTNEVLQQPQAGEPVNENMVPQSKVNDILAAEKAKAYQRGQNDALAQVQQAPVATPQAQAPVLDPDDIAAKAALKAAETLKQQMEEQSRKDAEESRKRQMEEMERTTIASLQKKLGGINERIPDWRETVEKSGLSNNDALWALTDAVENPGETMYELSKSPDKAIMVLSALQSGNYAVAQQYLSTLSESLKANEVAKNAPHISKPLDKITPSNTNGSGGSSSSRSVTDWKRYFSTKR